MDEMDEGSTTRSSQKEGDVGNGVGWGGGRGRKARCFWKPMLAAAGSKLAMDPVNSSSEGLKKQDDVADSVQAFEAHIGI
jgi:hypothetical protein